METRLNHVGELGEGVPATAFLGRIKQEVEDVDSKLDGFLDVFGKIVGSNSSDGSIYFQLYQLQFRHAIYLQRDPGSVTSS